MLKLPLACFIQAENRLLLVSTFNRQTICQARAIIVIIHIKRLSQPPSHPALQLIHFLEEDNQ